MPGTLGAASLRRLIESGHLVSEAPIAPDQIQPASIDLTLSAEAYRMPGSALALAGERVRDLVSGLALDRLDLSRSTCLARNQVYLIRLRERLDLPPGLDGYANSKSSTGRIDLATRLLTDGSSRYDRVRAGYAGELWLEAIPRSFDVVARAGDSLDQILFFQNRQLLDHRDLSAWHARQPLIHGPDLRPIPAEERIWDGRVMMTADLCRPVVGFVAKRTHKALDLARVGRHQADDFFAPLLRPTSGYLFLEKDAFYILSTCERICVPAELACEMVPFDPTAGEFRAHYAGFFDPGWGLDRHGTSAVLEVRPHADDLILRHGQPICAMAYEVLDEPCPTAALYGRRANNYGDQAGPRLSKHFQPST